MSSGFNGVARRDCAVLSSPLLTFKGRLDGHDSLANSFWEADKKFC